jgi:hypothetical protein
MCNSSQILVLSGPLFLMTRSLGCIILLLLNEIRAKAQSLKYVLICNISVFWIFRVEFSKIVYDEYRYPTHSYLNLIQ